MAAPTNNDKAVFTGIEKRQKLQILIEYLWEGTGNMAEVGDWVFPGEGSFSASQKVSCVTRCYGFGDNNRGVYKKWGIAKDLVQDDLEAFIEKYPNGCRYDGNGVEMQRFLSQRIEIRKRAAIQNEQMYKQQQMERNRQEQALLQKEREIAHAEALKRQELEEYYRKQQEMQEKQKQIQHEYSQRQLSAKNRAYELQNSANSYWKDGASIEEVKKGVSIFQEARKIVWKGPSEMIENFEVDTRLPLSNMYLQASLFVAQMAYKNGNYGEALQYCRYIYEDIYSQDSAGWNFVLEARRKQRTDTFYPEAICFEIELDIYRNPNAHFYNVQEAVNAAERGVIMGSVECTLFMAKQYENYEDEESLESAWYYYDLLKGIDTPAIIQGREHVINKIMDKRAQKVDAIMQTLRADWLPTVGANGDIMGWESYSNMPDTVLNSLPRKTKNNNAIQVYMEIKPSVFKRVGYHPGMIDLEELWNYYKHINSVVQRTGFIIKKKTYDYRGKLLEGDFVDCCKFLWERNRAKLTENYG